MLYRGLECNLLGYTNPGSFMDSQGITSDFFLSTLWERQLGKHKFTVLPVICGNLAEIEFATCAFIQFVISLYLALPITYPEPIYEKFSSYGSRKSIKCLFKVSFRGKSLLLFWSLTVLNKKACPKKPEGYEEDSIETNWTNLLYIERVIEK